MNSVAEDIGGLLQSESVLGLVIGTNLHVSDMPASPDECVAIYDTGGGDPEADYSYDRPTFQIEVRGSKRDYRGAYDLARSIRDYLAPLANVTVGSTRYVGVWAMGDVFFLGYDENARPMLTLNFRAHRTE